MISKTIRGSRWLAGESAYDIMERNRGSGPGFDLWRVSLSVVVIVLHSIHVVTPNARFLATGPFGPVFAAVLPIFFGLSGFLVTGSALRTRSVKVFLAFRGLRIIPALATEVTLAALILGPLLTTLPLAEYFSDTRFFVYFGNIVGWVHFNLPGVFETNPRQGIVNRNLWTLHPELQCYAMLAGLMLLRIVYHRSLMTAFVVVLTLGMFVMQLKFGMFRLHGTFPGQVLVYSFLCGVVAYHWRAYIRINGWLFVGSLVAVYGLLKLPNTTFIVVPILMYVMVYVGMIKLPRVQLLQRGDYSYGLYLYAFPVQQSLVLMLGADTHWTAIFVLTTVITLGIAALSWHLVEKPALKLKRFVKNAPAPVKSLTEPPLDEAREQALELQAAAVFRRGD